ncbi:hypothetical protein TMatcc_002951 [Talaromyces marneffei ATCC 18224]
MMVRRGGRSKACASCRRHKKKCDEVYPQCGPCVAASRPCPCPIQGNIFVNTDVSTIHNKAARHAANHNAQTRIGSAIRTGPSARGPIHQLQRGSTSTSRRSNESCTLSGVWKEFHSVPLHDIQVISNLVQYYTLSGRKRVCSGQDKQSWLIRLPSLLQQNLSIRMRAPLLAPSLVLIALQSKQPGVMKEALKWYDRGLGYLRTRLKHLNDNVTDEAEDNFLIYAALFMSIYESLQTTVIGGYEQHVIGAVALLQAKGPELFAKPEYHDLFLAIRGHAIHVSLMTGNPTCLANEEWLLTPFPQQTRTKFEIINDILLLIPKYLSELRKELYYAVDTFKQDSAKQKFIWMIDSMKKDLDELQGHILQFLRPMPSSRDSILAPDIGTNENEPDYCDLYDFTSPIHAKIVAMSACARIVILGILSSTTLSTPPWPCFFPIENWHDETLVAEIEEASKQILSASQYLSQFIIGCAYSRMILPLQVVGQMSPNQAQRETARNILEFWYNDTPVKGLTLLALQAIDTTSYYLSGLGVS